MTAEKTLTDVHVHLAALPTRANGCRISPRMIKTPLAKFIAWRDGYPLDDPETCNRLYLEKLKAELDKSQRVAKAVLLAMDGAYDSSGMLDESHTDFLISNDAVLSAAASDSRLLAGVSINPSRRDAIDELERCAARGAALVKVLPNAQVFDPSEKRFLPFFKALARLKVPLLSHVGFEFSLIGQDQSVGDPARLVPALDAGVTVIAAHGCSYGVFLYEKYFGVMLDLVRRYPNFYVDTSALTLPNRAGALLRLSRHPELFERLVFGTDYPLPCFSFPCLLAAKPLAYAEAFAADNRFDRHASVLDSLGIRHGTDFAALRRTP